MGDPIQFSVNKIYKDGDVVEMDTKDSSHPISALHVMLENSYRALYSGKIKYLVIERMEDA